MVHSKVLALFDVDLSGKKLTFKLSPPPPSAEGQTLEDKVVSWGLKGSSTGPRLFIIGETYSWEEGAGDVTVETSDEGILLFGVQQPADLLIQLGDHPAGWETLKEHVSCLKRCFNDWSPHRDSHYSQRNFALSQNKLTGWLATLPDEDFWELTRAAATRNGVEDLGTNLHNPSFHAEATRRLEGRKPTGLQKQLLAGLEEMQDEPGF
jgi:hypothetical protein